MPSAAAPASSSAAFEAVLVVNAGSSSMKAALFDAGRARPVLLCRAEVAGIRKQASLVVEEVGETPRTELLPGVRTHEQAMARMLDWVSGRLGSGRLLAAGHRIVHGGDRTTPIPADPKVLAELDRLVPLAPIHQPSGLRAVRSLAALDPELPQVLCFDTAFHAALPPVARMFALPRRLYESGVRRYGFHGLSYEYIAEELPDLLGPAADGRVVVAHLGAGASLCAMRERRSVATTMGMTPLDGLPMGTRCGSLDPGVVLHLLRARGMALADVEDLLNNESGLFGVSGVSGRMEFLLRSGSAEAAEAIDLFVYRAAGEIAAMAAALGGLDALVFTAGIGEHSPEIRSRIARRCEWLGVVLDDAANEAGGPRLTAEGSPVSAWVAPTDEAAMIARHTVRLLAGAGREAR